MSPMFSLELKISLDKTVIRIAAATLICALVEQLGVIITSDLYSHEKSMIH